LCERRVRQPIDAATKDGQATDQPARCSLAGRDRRAEAGNRDRATLDQLTTPNQAPKPFGLGYAAHTWRYRAAQVKQVPCRFPARCDAKAVARRVIGFDPGEAPIAADRHGLQAARVLPVMGRRYG